MEKRRYLRENLGSETGIDRDTAGIADTQFLRLSENWALAYYMICGR